MDGCCSIVSCDELPRCRGLCYRHYSAWRRRTRTDVCSFESCTGRVNARSLCGGHYAQLLGGRPLAPLKSNRRAECRIEGCDQLSEAQRLCRKHYYRWKANGDPNVVVIAPKGAGCISKGGYRVLVFGGKQVPEHRWIMERRLGRQLLPEETVHHINGVRDDNRTENLELWSSSHPPGQRVDDKVTWAVRILRQYAPEHLRE
jgi:hypothetical protein